MRESRLPMHPAAAPFSNWFPFRSAYLWLIVWGTLVIWSTLQGDALHSFAAIGLHVAVLGWGFAGNLLAGAAGPLLFRWHGVVVSNRRTNLVATLFSASTLLQILPTARGLAPTAFAAATGGGVALHLHWRRIRPDGPTRVGDQASDLLLVAAATYGLLAAAASWTYGAMAPVTTHLFLAGVVATTIFAVAHRFLPRFSRHPMPPWLHAAQAHAAAVGPLLLALGIQHQWTPWSALGGIVEAAAAALFLVMAIRARRWARSPHPVLTGFLFGATGLFLGAGLGIHFLNHPDLRTHIPLHAVNNLVVFVTVIALAMASVLLGVGVRAIPGKVVTRVRLLIIATPVALWTWGALAWFRLPHADALAIVVAVLVALHGVLGLASDPWLGQKGPDRSGKKSRGARQ